MEENQLFAKLLSEKTTIKKSCERDIRGGQAHHKKFIFLQKSHQLVAFVLIIG